MLKPLPISTYTFRDIIKNDYLYIDKTKYVYELVRYPKRIYFIARPRRFGKSLLISTLKEVFEGNQTLFEDLWIGEANYQWETYPLIWLDFSRERVYTAAELEEAISEYLLEVAAQYSLTLQPAPYQRLFRRLIQGLATQRQVVILIDEYDKPILDNLDNLEEAKQIRETLKNFYAIIKAMDQYLHIVFITGISKFSQVSVFSALNNLVDLSMNTQFSGMLGLTHAEVERDLAKYCQACAAEQELSLKSFMEAVRYRYNGFCFAANGEQVYNPFSVINLLYQRRFASYWFETGTPTFLIKLLYEGTSSLPQLKNLTVPEYAFKTYDLENLEIVPLLFQTGYLTIQSATVKPGQDTIYTLSYPNYEVEEAFLAHILDSFSYTDRKATYDYLTNIKQALREKNLEKIFDIISTFFANIPYKLQIKYERYYQTIFYTVFMLIGLEIETEIETNVGRIDVALVLPHHIFIFEFKIDKSAQEALQQIKQNQYAQKYRLRDKPITLVGANFNSQTRTVDEWKSEFVG